MTAYEDVLQWAVSRPWWQQKALARIATEGPLDEQDYEEIAKSLLQEPESAPNGGWFAKLVPSETTKDESVRIVAVKELANVNRLAADQELTFEPDGLTVVFGNNGSGKSGYARVIRSIVRARHKGDILPDVFADTDDSPSGKVIFQVGDTERTAQLGQSADPDFSRVAFYDEHCGDTYLTKEMEISYRPSAVQLLEELGKVCVGVHKVLSKWKEQKSNSGPLPEVSVGSAGEKFLKGLNAATPDDELTAAVACPSDVAELLEKQMKEVSRLREIDPTKERDRLKEAAEALDLIADHLEEIDKNIGVQAETQLRELTEKAETAQRAADLASSEAFDNKEPLSEVGSQAWKALWRAAESYSKVAYPNHDFPHTTDGAVCVLCQQALGTDAAERLMRFQQFVMDTTAQEAQAAQEKAAAFRKEIDGVEVEPATVQRAIEKLKHIAEIDTEKIDSIIEVLDNRKFALLSDGKPKRVEVIAAVSALRKEAASCREQGKKVDAESFKQKLAQAKSRECQLRDQIAMRDGRQLIETERTRLQELAKLDERLSETNSRQITEKVKELTQKYVTGKASQYFTREAKKLGLEHVTFGATKARQGSLLHKADFRDACPGTKLADVLSEGEQTSLGFAGFLTEAHFDVSKSALIFDDPVSSLDHMKRESVARRIVELAQDRQVVVFTHDVAFTMLLRKAAKESTVSFATRGIEKQRRKGPGYTTSHHPWAAKDAFQRVNTLKKEVADLRKKEEGMSEEDYQQETENIAGHMSQTWERIISQVIAEPLVDYASLEVRVGKLRIIGRVTEEDVKTYDDSYSRISGWASRHDPHPELNYSPPTVEQLNDEIEVIADWLTRVKKYQA